MINSLVELPNNNLEAFLKGLIPSLVCIIIVFLVLSLLAIVIGAINKLKFLDEVQKQPIPKSIETSCDIDDDMMAAILACAIDYREEVKTDIKVIGVRRIG